jgi:hypothetical protein
MRIVAVDWSGAMDGAHKTMWCAEVVDGRLVRLENGRSRDQLVDHLLDVAAEGPDLVVGLDFAFSAPAWFLESLGLKGASDLWSLASSQAEVWIEACEPPFWGRGPRKRPELSEHFRLTDQMRIGGISPKSVFQLGGAGHVGTGSLRGWPHLARLADAGFSIWPFSEAAMPLVVEIYPRALTGAVIKSSAIDRCEYLERNYPEIGSAMTNLAASTADAFDAAVSALVMARHQDQFTGLAAMADPAISLEGYIWQPVP